MNNLGNFKKHRSASKNHVYPGKVGDPARTSVSWFAVLWRGLMIFHPHLLWVSLCWLICFSQAKRERKNISCFCSGGSGGFGKRVPVGPGCWEKGARAGCPKGAQLQPEGPSGSPKAGDGWLRFPFPPSEAEYNFVKITEEATGVSLGKEIIPGKTKL